MVLEAERVFVHESARGKHRLFPVPAFQHMADRSEVVPDGAAGALSLRHPTMRRLDGTGAHLVHRQGDPERSELPESLADVVRGRDRRPGFPAVTDLGAHPAAALDRLWPGVVAEADPLSTDLNERLTACLAVPELRGAGRFSCPPALAVTSFRVGRPGKSSPQSHGTGNKQILNDLMS